KATMEVPSPQAGKVSKLLLKTGDKVSKGTAVLELQVEAGATATVKPATAGTKGATGSSTPEASKQGSSEPETSKPGMPEPAPSKPAGALASGQSAAATSAEPAAANARVHAGPAVRRLARDLGVDLGNVTATGPRDRIMKED